MFEILDPFEPDVDELISEDTDETVPESTDDIAEPGEDTSVVGEPDEDAGRWFEQSDNTCVTATLTQIVAEYTGRTLNDESALTQLALELGFANITEKGEFSGMWEFGAEGLLESVGIPATVYSNLTIDDLAGYLAEDRSVALVVDGHEIWEATGQGADPEEGTPAGEGADHVLLLTGIDVEKGVAYLNDTGSPEGKMLEIPLEDLLDAWADSDYAAIVCDQAAPDDLPPSTIQGGATVDALTDGPWALLAAVVRVR